MCRDWSWCSPRWISKSHRTRTEISFTWSHRRRSENASTRCLPYSTSMGCKSIGFSRMSTIFIALHIRIFFFFLSLESHSNPSFTRSKCSRQTTMGISYEIHGKYSSKRTRIATIEINLDNARKFLVEISRHAIKNDRTKISTAMCQRIRKTSSQSTTIRSNNEE